jgi:hypothetical protein
MYKGTKFNTRMEDVQGERYLGIKIFRFYFRCSQCSAEFALKTDPKNADYIVEGGATRNYELWKDQEETKEAAVVAKEDEEKGNAIKALENRAFDSKREMDIMAALDDMRAIKASHAAVGPDAALAALRREAAAGGAGGEEEEEDLDEEEAAALQQMLLAKAGFVRRLSSSDDDDDDKKKEGEPSGAHKTQQQRQQQQQQQENKDDFLSSKPALPKFAVKAAAVAVIKKAKVVTEQQQQKEDSKEQPGGVGLGGLLGGYGSSSSGED